MLGAFGNDATRSDIIEVVQILGGVALHLVGVNLFQRLYGLSLQSHIIIIGGVDDGIFCLGIAQDTQIAFGQQVAFFVDATQGTIGQLTVFIERTVVGTTLTETHLLHIRHKALYLIVSDFRNITQAFLRLVILHPYDVDKGQMIQGLCPTLVVMTGAIVGLLGIMLRRVEVTIMIGIRQTIQPVHILFVRL